MGSPGLSQKRAVNRVRACVCASTSPFGFFYRPDALPATQPTASKHGRLNVQMWQHKVERCDGFDYDKIPIVFFFLRFRSTQPCIPPGSLNQVLASAGVKAGMSPLPGGR